MRKYPTTKTVKKLFALSGNICAFPKCNQNLVNENGDILAQICHIEAAEKGGERYNPSQTDEERRSFENLLLLCANHHIESNNVDIWTVIKLKDIKTQHEQRFLNNKFEISDETANKTVGIDLLEHVKTELDTENVIYVQKYLKDIQNLISNLADGNISLEYEILDCRCLHKLEQIDEAKAKYESLMKRFPKDPRAFLYLAEIYLNDKDFNKNLDLLQKAEEIDKDFWLLQLEKLVRNLHLEEKIDLEKIDETNFPRDPKIKSNFYRLYALFFEYGNDQITADSFIEKAIYANPERFSNHLTKLDILGQRFLAKRDLNQKQQAQELIEEITKVENKFGDISIRSKVILNIKKLNVLSVLEKFPEITKVSKETFELLINCYFDNQIDQFISIILKFVSLHNDDLNKLLEYIKKSRKEISDELSKLLILEFNTNQTLLTDGKKFFTEIKSQKYLAFVNDLENEDFVKVLAFLEDDNQFLIDIAHTSNDDILKQLIIDFLLENNDISEIELIGLFDNEKVFEILQKNGIDKLNLNYFDLQKILSVAHQKDAWDFEVIILQKLIAKEENEKQKFNLQLQLFNACFNLEQYREVIKLGKELLEIDFTKNNLDTKNKEVLLANTITALFKRGTLQENSYIEAQEILEKYKLLQPSFEFTVRIEAEVYLHINNPQKALDTVVESIKIKKILSLQEYVNLYLLFIKVENLIDLTINSLNEITENVFVKLTNKDQWYFIGEGNELDAIKVSKIKNKYSLFEGKKLGDKVVFTGKYNSKKFEEIIEFIFSIDKYIVWKVYNSFDTLSKDGDLEGVLMIEIPQKGDSIDLKNILKMMEDMHKRTEPFFEMYIKNNVPLAMLAVNEGGIINAIDRIQNEQKGFINFSNGTIEEFEKQKEIARSIVKNNAPFYLDGTSSLFLSRIGYFSKIYKYIPNINIPQSVINLLVEVNQKFTYMPGQVGYMGYIQGKLKFSSIEQEKNDNIIDSIKLLELKPDNIKVISNANKSEIFTEMEIPAELSDACILSKKDNLPIMTEDFMYLQMNALETQKEASKYFSSLALIRVLYEDKEISFDDYLEYFGYLSSYRFRFLPFSINDIEIAIFGNGEIKTIKPQNIKKFNFPLILSEEYGVPFKDSFVLLGGFLFKILIDNTITADVIKKIFIEILDSFPTNRSKKDLGQMFLKACINEIENRGAKSVLLQNYQVINEKLDVLLQTTQMYNSGNQILIP